MSEESDIRYIQERLDSLYEIDTKIVTLLDNMSSAISNLHEGKKMISQSKEESLEEVKKQFKENCGNVYENLSSAVIGLRREIKLLDHRTNANVVSDKEVRILPVNINKKAVWVGEWKLNQEVENLEAMLEEKAS
ncbi:unnamed protein product [Kuraishia capsulata CBS 1993]|uniref:Mediator of RNA polymerase II transcription subunit 11 n=1 Tax=Kuraishia capsulata CBS 1993 TaxID=1382522 RepID=W6MS26_9ASCO|nr:uncharacterized protein KUCA_T00005584001 [Kuraishia capsulata CBS 1993]CDK29591.1 unnamed protein product [Kuraishia capsulata CBS 1993]